MKLRQFSDLPISQKLMMIMLLTSVTAVLAASIFFAASEALNYQRNTVSQIATLGDVIGTTSTAAITFEDQVLASQALRSLSADEAVVKAHMYTADGRMLAEFQSAAPGAESIDSNDERIQTLVQQVLITAQPAQQFEGLEYLDAVRPIVFDGELIGLLHLRASLSELVATMKRIALMAGITVLVAIIVAYFLSLRLQAVVSSPILRLSDLMKRVTRRQDYSLRAEPSGRDEIGTLMAGFNDMLEQISSRDLKLAEANSRLKRAVKETLRAKEAAESASSAKSDFLARMSHEIRTPMNGVLGMAELLLTSNIKGNDRKFAETIQQSGEALLAVINDVLDFSKIEAGKLALDESDFDLVDVVEGIVDLLYNRAQAQGVELIGAISPDIDTMVHGDSVRLRQVLMNLVGNAIKFTHEGEVVLQLTREESAAGEPLFRFAVRDTGIGICDEDLALIFDSFAQADVSTTRKYGGTGLGLAICKQLVELMGGDIGVESQKGKGSTFWFRMPLVPVVSGARSAEGFDPLIGIRALVVDDNETNRELLYQQLSAWHVDVTLAVDAAQAIETCEAAARDSAMFDLILLDFCMPGTDGLQLAADIFSRPLFGQPRMMMLSSSGAEHEAARHPDTGIDLYLSKPVRRKTLYRSLLRVMQAGKLEITGNTAINPILEQGSLLPGLTVLLVEDIPINMQVARLMVSALGCDVIEATNGEEALAAIEKQRPDFVLMDCQMPVMDGYTACRTQRAREMRAGSEPLTIIALTANALDDDRQRCIDAGMDDFVSKPFSKQTLLAAIARCGLFDKVAEATLAPAPAPEATLLPAAHEQPTLDAAALDQIADLDPDGDGSLVVEIIETYVDNAQSLIGELGEAWLSKDAARATAASHSLKSSSANVGAKRLAGICSSIEQNARAGDLDDDAQLIDNAKAEFAAAIEQLLARKSEIAA